MEWGGERINYNEERDKTLRTAQVLELANANRRFEEANSLDDLKVIVRSRKTLLEDDGMTVVDGESTTQIIDAYAHANQQGREFIFNHPGMFPQIKSLRTALVDVLKRMSRAA